MTRHPIFKVSVAASAKSGAFVIKDAGEARLYYRAINSGAGGDAFPQPPDHELILPKDGWLEDFILGDFGNPYVSSRAAELLKKEWGNDLEFISLGSALPSPYYILVVRSRVSSIDGVSCVVNGEINYPAFLGGSAKTLGVFRIVGREEFLFATSHFGEFIQRHTLTGAYLRDPEALLKKTEILFGLPMMKNGLKPQLQG